MSVTAKMTGLVPKTDVSVPLLRGRQWLAVLGSVGQPRDGDPSAAFVLFDTVSCEITYCRVPYDIAARRTRSARTACRPGSPTGCRRDAERRCRNPWSNPAPRSTATPSANACMRGGMATLWTVTHPGIDVPLLMKIPRVSEGEDPAAIV